MNNKFLNFIKIIFLSLFLSSGMILQTSYSSFTNIFIIISSIVLCSLNYDGILTLKLTRIDLLFFIFIFVSAFSSVFIFDFDNLFSVIKYLLFYIVMNFYMQVEINNNNEKILDIALVISTTVVIVLTLINHPVTLTTSNYRGIFDNPNNFGIFIAPVLMFVLIKIFKKSTYKIKFLLIYIPTSIILLYLLLISANRTALFAFGITFIILIILYLSKRVIEGKTTLLRFLSTIFIIFLLIVLYYWFKNSSFYDIFENNIIAKFIARKGKSDLTSGRVEIWRRYFENSNFFGTKSGELKDYIGFSAHNTFIFILSTFGFFSGIMYIIFWMVSLMNLLILFFRFKDFKFNVLLSIAMILLFILMSFMEVLPNTLSVYLSYYSVAFINTYKKI